MNQKETNHDSKLVPDVQRQYSLLREFNLEQAQAGDEILHLLSPSFNYTEVIHEVKFKGVTSNLQEVFLEDKQGEGYVCGTQRVKMKPLCWLEGKPVYKGDVLYYNFIASKELIVVEALTFEDGSVGIRTNLGGEFNFTHELTWDKPKEPKQKSGWINIWKCSSAIGVSTGSQIYLSKEDALTGLLCQWDIVDTVEITWME